MSRSTDAGAAAGLIVLGGMFAVALTMAGIFLRLFKVVRR